MGKRNYTHFQALLPEIKAMIAEGKTQREVAEYYGFLDKKVGKGCLSVSGEKTQVGSENSSSVQRTAEERCCAQRYCGGAGKRDSAAAQGKQAAAEFSALHRKEVKARVKYHIIYRHKAEYPVAVMCQFFAVSRSSYYAFVHRLGRPERDAALAELIRQQRKRRFGTYGYQRMWLWLKRQNIFYNPKTVQRVMKKYDLLSEMRRHRKWQKMGQQLHKYKTLLNREFHADGPNRK